ncbi:MAG: DUF3365 domain-containing protein [Verrucomicrobiales bacterium]|nr:DUF3365 domain-containing protein [Verrucomicrobiales bacterium]
MKISPSFSVIILMIVTLAFSAVGGWLLRAEDDVAAESLEGIPEKAKENLPSSESEARGRARWMHEAMHGALQVMHRDFFGDGDDGESGALALPSQSLEDVFKEMSRSWMVDIRWLGVNATKDKGHDPQDEFEQRAADALKKGAEEFYGMEDGRYRFVGAITLHNQCLKCHVPYRSNLDSRVAGLAISMPVNFDPVEESEKSGGVQ